MVHQRWMHTLRAFSLGFFSTEKSISIEDGSRYFSVRKASDSVRWRRRPWARDSVDSAPRPDCARPRRWCRRRGASSARLSSSSSVSGRIGRLRRRSPRSGAPKGRTAAKSGRSSLFVVLLDPNDRRRPSRRSLFMRLACRPFSVESWRQTAIFFCFNRSLLTLGRRTASAISLDCLTTLRRRVFLTLLCCTPITRPNCCSLSLFLRLLPRGHQQQPLIDDDDLLDDDDGDEEVEDVDDVLDDDEDDDDEAFYRATGASASAAPDVAEAEAAAAAAAAGGQLVVEVPAVVETRFDVGRIIGDGNFAVVREGVDRRTAARYALKLIDKKRCQVSPCILPFSTWSWTRYWTGFYTC